MILRELGYRRPSPGEIWAYREDRAEERPWFDKSKIRPFYVPAAVLNGTPLVSYSGIVPSALLGVASLLGPRMWMRRACFLVSPTWSIDDRSVAYWLRRHAVLHRVAHPLHSVVFVCNTEDETRRMRSLGEAAFTHNKTTHVSDQIFRPLECEPVEFDAIYNAQLAPWKRHELSVSIPRCGFLFYRGIDSTSESEARLIADHMAAAPGHEFINDIDSDGAPIRLSPEEVNRQLNRASVGLCLSAEEGAMFACAEYLLSGLPVVTTPNTGGRDFYLDDEICITVPADPREIAAAVSGLKARNIPREYVRKRALERIAAERTRFVSLINELYAELGIQKEFEGFWPLKRPVVMQWLPPRLARRNAIKGAVDELIAGEGDPDH